MDHIVAAKMPVFTGRLVTSFGHNFGLSVMAKHAFPFALQHAHSGQVAVEEHAQPVPVFGCLIENMPETDEFDAATAQQGQNGQW